MGKQSQSDNRMDGCEGCNGCSTAIISRNAMGKMEIEDLITCCGSASKSGIMCIIGNVRLKDVISANGKNTDTY